MLINFETRTHRALVDNVNGNLSAALKHPRMTARNDYEINIHDMFDRSCISRELSQLLTKAYELAPDSLNDEEIDVINLVIKASRMDCWFSLCDGWEGYYVHDLEENKNIDIREGLKLICEGISGLPEFVKKVLNTKSKKVFINLLTRLKITNPDIETLKSKIF